MKRYIAVFHPQKWAVHGQPPVSVAPSGPTEWDVTDFIEGLPEGSDIRERYMTEDTWESDLLTDHPNAPAWVKSWRGPYYVSVEERTVQ